MTCIIIIFLLFSVVNAPLEYYAVIVKKAGSPIRIDSLALSKACTPGTVKHH